MEYTGNDFYCDVAMKELVSLEKKYESDQVLAYHHTHPHWPVRIVVVPKKHIASFTTIAPKDGPILEALFFVIQKIACKIETECGSCRILTYLGTYQDSMHLHFISM